MRLGTCRDCGQPVRSGQPYRLAKGQRQRLVHEHCPPKLVLVKS